MAIALCAVVVTDTPSVAAAVARKPAPTEGGGAQPRWTLQRCFTEPITVAGDEDIDRFGDVYDVYEDDQPDPTAKLFTITITITITTPNGTVSDYPHPLAPGEEYNNSFVTVSPDDRWLVSGEWSTERRLVVSRLCDSAWCCWRPGEAWRPVGAR